MKVISVNASGHYDIIIGTGLLSNAGEYIQKVQKKCKVAIISDTNVWPIYGETLNNSLLNSGFSPVSFVFPTIGSRPSIKSTPGIPFSYLSS